jgi:glycosyltransferase involved in cell wall biosynthesis
VFVLPCIRTPEGDVDGIPNALAEAMALQVPVISTELPAIRELVADGVNGVLVRPGDDEGLAEAITRLLDQPALREELGAEGRRTILRSFDVEANVRRFADTLWPDRLVGEAVERR